MNPVISELQNIELARAFGPTATLGGQLVQAERDLAQQEQLWASRRSATYPNVSTTSTVTEDCTRLSPVATIGEAVHMVVSGVAGLWLPWMFIISMIASVVGIPQELALGVGWWAGVIILTAIFTSLAVSELRATRKRLKAPLKGCKEQSQSARDRHPDGPRLTMARAYS